MTVVGPFDIHGIPAAQGSKTAVMIGGKARLIEGKGTAGRQKHRDWRTTVAQVAADHAATLDKPLDGPLEVTVIFRFPMPASRPKRDRERGWCDKTTAPDIDKLLRACFDGLQAGGLIASDARICWVQAAKVETTGWTGATVHIGHAEPEER